MPLLPFSLPLQKQPPVGYGWEEGHDFSVPMTTTGFCQTVDQRDRFLGQTCCVVCGVASILECCHIVGQEIWSDLRRSGWVPSQTTEEPQLEPRNGLILCCSCSAAFKRYSFFIRFFPDIQKFVFVNYYDMVDYRKFHGKAVALDVKDLYAPLPSLFIIHEIRARGFHPFPPVNPDVPNGNHWQDWITLGGVFDDVSHSFRRSSLPHSSVTAHPLPEGCTGPSAECKCTH